MAGNTENPETTGQFRGFKDEVKLASPPARVVKSFTCKSCGSPVSLRNPGESLTVICPACKSIIDASDDNYNIIQEYNKRTSPFLPLLIELGTRGVLFGKKWEAIGFIVRQDDASNYIWYEYLLFNPYYGYRWLVQADGHWSFVRPLKDKFDNEIGGDSRGAYLDYNGRRHKIFNSGAASILFVIGEFYWRLKVDDKVWMVDYVNAPFMISSETDKNEVSWSLGEYVEPALVEKAFRLKSGLLSRGRIGVGANQPNPDQAVLNKLLAPWMVFALVLTILQFWQLLQIDKSQYAITQNISYVPNTKSQQSVNSPVFELKKNLANLKLKFQAPVDNSWVYVSGDLVNNDTGTTYSFERSIEQYHGVDDGEYWSEGEPKSELMLSSIPGGKYYLSVDYESGMYADQVERNFTIDVVRDVPTYANYFWCLLMISILPIWYWLTSRQFEVKRWSNSDFSPYQTSDE